MNNQSPGQVKLSLAAASLHEAILPIENHSDISRFVPEFFPFCFLYFECMRIFIKLDFLCGCRASLKTNIKIPSLCSQPWSPDLFWNLYIALPLHRIARNQTIIYFHLTIMTLAITYTCYYSHAVETRFQQLMWQYSAGPEPGSCHYYPLIQRYRKQSKSVALTIRDTLTDYE